MNGPFRSHAKNDITIIIIMEGVNISLQVGQHRAWVPQITLGAKLWLRLSNKFLTWEAVWLGRVSQPVQAGKSCPGWMAETGEVGGSMAKWRHVTRKAAYCCPSFLFFFKSPHAKVTVGGYGDKVLLGYSRRAAAAGALYTYSTTYNATYIACSCLPNRTLFS